MADNIIEDLPGEIWKDMAHWEDSYEMSTRGRCKSKDRYINNRFGLTLRKGQLRNFSKKAKTLGSFITLFVEIAKKVRLKSWI